MLSNFPYLLAYCHWRLDIWWIVISSDVRCLPALSVVGRTLPFARPISASPAVGWQMANEIPASCHRISISRTTTAEGGRTSLSEAIYGRFRSRQPVNPELGGPELKNNRQNGRTTRNPPYSFATFCQFTFCHSAWQLAEARGLDFCPQHYLH
ncbi:hypothetical protein BD410DRAFT_537148 [Rickenella mellea]|uniref:Uncharacterized protein n=1 Tax=Rickenella mellea TaxID=50990 RepID=A0A4Y7PRJ4_9AGAM|nr:hypothetical protein BD410DRAFT_537148 [Rickenella mellea]